MEKHLRKMLRDILGRQNLADLLEVRKMVDALIRDSEPHEVPEKEGREVVETRKQGGATYRLEKVRCGKKGCKCEKGELHGPYWYGYRRQKGKLKSHYIGKELREEKKGGLKDGAQVV